ASYGGWTIHPEAPAVSHRRGRVVRYGDRRRRGPGPLPVHDPDSMTGENMKREFLAALLLACLPAAAEVENYTIDPRHTFPAYEVNHLTFSIQRGRFNKTRGKIALDLA